jgi:hypothetical protein
LNGSDVIAPGHGDAIFGSFQLRLQRQEVLIGLEIGIAFADRKQPPKRTGKLGLAC